MKCDIVASETSSKITKKKPWAFISCLSLTIFSVTQQKEREKKQLLTKSSEVVFNFVSTKEMKKGELWPFLPAVRRKLRMKRNVLFLVSFFVLSKNSLCHVPSLWKNEQSSVKFRFVASVLTKILLKGRWTKAKTIFYGSINSKKLNYSEIRNEKTIWKLLLTSSLEFMKSVKK